MYSLSIPAQNTVNKIINLKNDVPVLSFGKGNTKIVITEKYLITFNKNQDYLALFYNRIDLKLQLKAVKLGIGANKLSFPSASYFDVTEQTLWLYDENAELFYPFKIAEKVGNIDILPKGVLHTKNLPRFNHEFAVLNKSSLLFFPSHHKSMFLKNESGAESYFGKKESMLINYAKIDADGLGSLHLRTAAAMHPDKTKIAVASVYFDELAIYSNDFKLLNKWNGDAKIQPVNYKSANPYADSQTYDYIYSGKQYIYISYYGKPYMYYDKKGDMQRRFNNTIRIFDWTGNFKAEVKLNRNFDSFAVDEAAQKIYIIDCDNTNVYSYKIDLKTLN